jgi:predicted dithiol-disulfide oxidoreductase (DUF899 family)
MEYTRLAGETDDYRDQREQLRRAELELIEHRERIAAMRRALPVGPVVDDYVFLEGPSDLDAGDEPVREVRLSELFTQPDRPDRSLIVYHLMYGKEQTTPCPMCTMWIDGFNGIARHVTENADLVIVAAADVPALRAHALDRGWYGLRLLSCGDNSFKVDFGSEDQKGVQDSTISVFSRDSSGAVHHRYSARPRAADDVDQRGIDLCCATWHLLDLTPGGRGDWYASLSYD